MYKHLLLILAIIYSCSGSKTFTEKPTYAPSGEKHRNVFDQFEKKQGLHKYYTRNKVLLLEIEYVDDKKHGVTRKYNAISGALKEEINYFDGKKDGEYKKFNTRDVLILELYYKKGKKDGPYKSYNSITGEISAEGFYKQNRPDGLWKFYDNRGVLKSTGQYFNGIKYGTWDYFDSESKLIKSEEYKNGKLVLPPEPKKESKEVKKPIKQNSKSPIKPTSR